MNNHEPIFICGCHKSGTSLLRSLFDGVPGYFALPLETHFFQIARFLITYPYRRTTPEHQTPDELSEALEDAVDTANAHRDARSDGVLAGRIDLNQFSQVLRMEAPSGTDHRAHFLAFARAFHRATTGSDMPADTRVVEKSVENAEVAAYWLALFPEASFVHIIRNPYANLVSLRKYKTSKGRFPYLRKPLEALGSSYDYVYRNELSLPRYVIVRYEDLVSDVRAAMMRICERLGIAYNERMSSPTFLGEAWGGNSMSGQSFHGVSESRLDSWKSSITPLEIELVNRRFANVLRDYDYPIAPTRGSTWRPCPGETIKAFVRNRGLLADLR